MHDSDPSDSPDSPVMSDASSPSPSPSDEIASLLKLLEEAPPVGGEAADEPDEPALDELLGEIGSLSRERDDVEMREILEGLPDLGDGDEGEALIPVPLTDSARPSARDEDGTGGDETSVRARDDAAAPEVPPLRDPHAAARAKALRDLHAFAREDVGGVVAFRLLRLLMVGRVEPLSIEEIGVELVESPKAIEDAIQHLKSSGLVIEVDSTVRINPRARKLVLLGALMARWSMLSSRAEIWAALNAEPESP